MKLFPCPECVIYWYVRKLWVFIHITYPVFAKIVHWVKAIYDRGSTGSSMYRIIYVNNDKLNFPFLFTSV